MRPRTQKPIRIVIAVVLVFVTVFSSLYPTICAQESIEFTTADQFEIPELNGSIKFAYNGTYSNAKLENGTWFFYDLTLNGSRPLGTLEASVENSKIIIYSFSAASAATQTRQAVRYFAEGAGKQVFDLGVNGTTDVSEWWVTITGSVFLAEGKDWKLLPNNTVMVNGQTGNISVVHFNFGVTDNSKLSFVERHSVALLTIVAVAVTVTAATLVSVKRRQR